MSLNDFEGFERANPIQRIVGFIASFVSCSAIVMYFFGSISTNQLINILLLWGLFGFFLYWLIGKLPYFLSRAFGYTFTASGTAAGWLFSRSTQAAGSAYRTGKNWNKPSKSKLPKWLFLFGVLLIPSGAFAWFVLELLARCIQIFEPNPKYIFYCPTTTNSAEIATILYEVSNAVLMKFNYLKLAFIGVCLIITSKRMSKKQQGQHEKVEPSFGDEKPNVSGDEYTYDDEPQPDRDPNKRHYNDGGFENDQQNEFADDFFEDSKPINKSASSGVENRHPEDVKLWAVVDDERANENERANAFRLILAKSRKRKNG